MVKITSLPIVAESSLEFSFGVRVLTEIKVRCIKYLLKVVLSGNYTPRCNLKDPCNITI